MFYRPQFPRQAAIARKIERQPLLAIAEECLKVEEDNLLFSFNQATFTPK